MRRLLLALALLALAAPSPALAQANQCEEPNVLIALDRSGSMLENQKWEQAVDAVTALTRTFEFRIRFGLLVFPWNGRCSVNSPEAILSGVAPLNGPGIRDQLARARPQESNKTPIGGAIDASVSYYFQLQDPNRRSFIILITDGMETCGGNPVRSAQNAFQGANLPVYVIGFGQGVDGRVLNQMAAAGGTERAYQANNGPDLFAALEAIADAATVETCDGADNDCDGEVDESLGDQACSTACGDGRQVCVDGTWSECFGGGIPDEVCDNVDNDCDTRVDEIDGVPCSTVSGNPGLAACVNGMVSDDCIPNDPSREEVCDAFDNDMDGRIDEGTDQECANGCHMGRRPCVDGVYLGCTARQVTDERCDGIDND
ncbi:MAG: VWA domain-containing protein, partial [Myxococcales bacterium]|nr:VWA domain-containing protein [Myxococcales bacterium]